MKTNIPKIIHYCWFGRGEKPTIVQKCINSWKDNMPQYEVKEWNEDNFDINCNEYVRQAYETKKYAFVSDYVRVYVLYNYGGIYMDTDVEAFETFDSFLEENSFWGFEAGNFIATSTIGSCKGNLLIKEFLDSYNGKTLLNERGEFIPITNVEIVSEIVRKYGVALNGKYQRIDGIGAFYPMEIFSPYDYRFYVSFKNSSTVTLHHFYKSWLPWTLRFKQKIKKACLFAIGRKRYAKIYDTLKL